MPDALLAEFCRSSVLHPSFIRRCQREFRQRIQPKLDRLVLLEDEVEALRSEVEALRAAAAVTKPRLVKRPKAKSAEAAS